MFDTTRRTRVRKDSYLDPRLAEFLSEEDRFRHQFFAVAGVICVATTMLFGCLAVLWAFLDT